VFLVVKLTFDGRQDEEIRTAASFSLRSSLPLSERKGRRETSLQTVDV